MNMVMEEISGFNCNARTAVKSVNGGRNQPDIRQWPIPSRRISDGNKTRLSLLQPAALLSTTVIRFPAFASFELGLFSRLHPRVEKPLMTYGLAGHASGSLIEHYKCALDDAKSRGLLQFPTRLGGVLLETSRRTVAHKLLCSASNFLDGLSDSLGGRR